jgi:hypothetical protein
MFSRHLDGQVVFRFIVPVTINVGVTMMVHAKGVATNIHTFMYKPLLYRCAKQDD